MPQSAANCCLPPFSASAALCPFQHFAATHSAAVLLHGTGGSCISSDLHRRDAEVRTNRPLATRTRMFGYAGYAHWVVPPSASLAPPHERRQSDRRGKGGSRARLLNTSPSVPNRDTSPRKLSRSIGCAPSSLPTWHSPGVGHQGKGSMEGTEPRIFRQPSTEASMPTRERRRFGETAKAAS